ncbi:MAG TPA: redoxin domain-containing protein, partial [Caulifigura sp.]|nr:redoxin domain-containing protein [Caulifigura sp.]
MSHAAEAGQPALMLRIAQLCCGLALGWGVLEPVVADDPTTDVAVERRDCLKATDLDGGLHRIAAGCGRHGTALVFLSTTCPISNTYLPQLKTTAARCRRHKIDFFGVIADSAVTRAEAIRHRDEFQLDFPVLFDVSGTLRRELKATHTPQAIVLSKTGEVVYSGRIDDLYGDLGSKRTSASMHELRDALKSLSCDESVAVASTTPIGCLLEDPPVEGAAEDVTFNRDIAPILYANCSGCHRPGEGTPFSLLSYADACQHGAQIAAVTQSRFMPPWHPESGFGHFQNERRLSQAEIGLIRQWVEVGKPEGDAADTLAPPEFATGWRLGKPDLILTMKEAFELHADGPDVHQHFVLTTGIPKDRLVSAVEFRPGNPAVAHHACFYLDTTGAARMLQAQESDVGYGSFVGPGFDNVGALRSWLPGMMPQHLPSGTGQLLPAHSDVVLEIHYRPSGKVESDRSVVGIHFASRSAKYLVGEIQVMNKALTIPAGAAEHRHTSSFTIPVDTALLDVLPHMHLLGREMKAVATRPDGVQVPLVWIRKWDFNWQDQYLYADPVMLPRGSRIDVEAV